MGHGMRARTAPATVAAALVLAAAAAPATAAPPTALTPAQSALAARGSAERIKERILPGHPDPTKVRARAAAAISGWGGTYTVKVGNVTNKVAIYTSTRLARSAAVNQQWANFFAGLPHGSELAKLKVYLAPLNQLRLSYVCGQWADSCYDPNYGIIYLTSEIPPDGASITQIAAHEYAHHIATWRLNTPWDALTWGPKYWATSARVCEFQKSGLMYPGDEGTHYEDNPAEIWAETYRVYASGVNGDRLDPWEIINSRWAPTSANLVAAGKDALKPWTGQVKSSASGSLTTTGAQSATVAVPVNLDGTVSATVSAKGGLMVKLAAYSADGSLLTASGSRSVNASVKACGTSRVDLVVTRLGGKGTWSLAVQSPGT